LEASQLEGMTEEQRRQLWGWDSFNPFSGNDDSSNDDSGTTDTSSWFDTGNFNLGGIGDLFGGSDDNTNDNGGSSSGFGGLGDITLNPDLTGFEDGGWFGDWTFDPIDLSGLTDVVSNVTNELFG